MGISKSENKINIIKDIVDKYNKEHISYDIMVKMYNSIRYGKSQYTNIPF